jgi:hypothetical protein
VGLFAVGAPDSQFLQWQYPNGLAVMPASGIASAAISFTAPSAPGKYELRLYARGYVRLATTTVTVTP